MLVCAWCETVIASRPAARAVHARSAASTLDTGAVSHGMCPSCRDSQLTALPAMPPLVPPALTALAR
jgi:hypothetical protein